LQNDDAFVFLIGNMLYLQHILFKPGMSGPIGEALISLLIAELAAFQMGSLEEDFFCISWNLTTEGLEYGLG
jgi:hypothetical protein